MSARTGNDVRELDIPFWIEGAEAKMLWPILLTPR